MLVHGVRNGRQTFANTLKYVFMATSANFGNMFSMAGASLFLPFLPLLPKQILLTNLLTDFPETSIAADSVDAELVRAAAAMGLPAHPAVHADLRSVELGLRLPDVRGPAAFAPGRRRRSSGRAGSSSRSSRRRRSSSSSGPGGRSSGAGPGGGFSSRPRSSSPPPWPSRSCRSPGSSGSCRLRPVFFAALGVILALYVGSAELVKALFYRRRRRTS